MSNPLVSVVIATYNAGEMLCSYSLNSVLKQTYKNLEIIVVDDGSIDDTEERVRAINDPRIVYRKIENNGNTNWYSCGVAALNHGLSLCTGEYICYCDDDDFFLKEKVETLVNFSESTGADIVHHPFLIHYEKFETFKRIYMESLTCNHGEVTTSSIFHKGKYKNITFGDGNNVLPGDWLKTKGILDVGGIPARFPSMLTLKNGHRECTSLRNRLYRPQLEPPPYKNVKN